MARPIVNSYFGKYLDTIYQEYVFPIIPVGSDLSDNSSLAPDQLGKIPGVFNMETKKWSGMSWPSFRAKRSNLERWDDQQAVTGPTAIGMNVVKFPALDVDVNDSSPHAKEIADLARSTAEGVFGSDTPVIRRREDSERCMLFFEHEDHTPPIRKVRHTFGAPDGTEHTIELLSSGQLVVVEGPHTSRKMHYWEAGDDDRGLVDHEGELPIINVTKVDAYFDRLDEVMAAFGYPRIKGSPTASGGGDNTPAVAVNDLSSPHMAKSIPQLEEAIGHIDLDDPQLDYDAFITLLRAICAACGGRFHFLHTVVWPWLCTQKIARGQSGKRTEERGIEWVEERWRSFPDSQVGAEHVYIWAAANGYTEALTTIKNTQVQDIFANAPIQTPDQPDAGANAGTAGPNAPALPGSPGGGGPVPPSDTHRAVALTFEAAFADERKFTVDTKEWLMCSTSGLWVPCHTLLSEIGDMAAQLGAQLLANPTANQSAARQRALESTGTHVSIRTQLQARPAMLIREEDFDADPHLLNTPDYVIDLRTGEGMDHSPGLLMRQSTLVTPEFGAYQSYEHWCPRFMAFLELLADGRDWVVPFLQRWFGYCLTGKISHQHFLFIQGVPGTGKTQVITILNKLMHTYATTLRSIWMMKNSEKRFDMVKIIGKRMGFSDETQKSSTFDEERLSNVAGSELLQAELKGGKEFDFPNRIKLILCGNHRPNFISGEAGGLTRRVLLLETTNKPIAEAGQVQEDFAKRLAAEEGSAILMWAVEGAMLDYADTDNLIFNSLKKPMVDAAYAYTRENSLYWQWVESKMRVGPLDEVDIDLIDAYEQFKDYVWTTTHERSRDRRTDFKAAMAAMLKDKIAFSKRTSGPHPNRAYIKGLGQAMVFTGTEGAGNVVSLDMVRDEKSVKVPVA